MLKQIYCENFKQKLIEFHEGLNTVLGTQYGDNSIGKSTMLMIIDFVFGGNDYIEKSTDVQSNVGPHEFKIQFVFGDKDYYFVRNNTNYNEVYICNKDFTIEKSITIDEYRRFLAKKYEITDLSFRECVSLFSRIYGRENLNEHKPLLLTPGLSDESGILNLVKLFGNYSTIEQYNKIFKEEKEKVNIYNKASKLNFISLITAKEYKNNIKKLEEVSKKLEEISDKYDQTFTDIDSTLSDAAIEIKNRLTNLRRQKSKEEAKLREIQRSADIGSVSITKDFSELQKFFPNLNVKKLSEIESFHKSVGTILKQEQNEEKNTLQYNINLLNEDISVAESELNSLLKTTNISKAILKDYSYFQKQKEILENQIKNYEKIKVLNNNKNVAEKTYQEVLQNEENKIESQLNIKILKVNEYIYGEEIKPPIFKLNNTKYSYSTPDDTGTGTNYKNLIIFDYSVLSLTQLPYIVHDSILLKQIADSALEKILTLYTILHKQTFISLDKQTTYSKQTQDILNNTKVLSLYPNGGELFGRAWNKKTKD